MIQRPKPGEYAPFYSNYINMVTDSVNIIDILKQLQQTTHQFFIQLPASKADYAYAPAKWTVKQLLGHMIDAERVFAYRILCFSRNDQAALPGFDENSYVEQAGFDWRALSDLADEFRFVRQSNLYLLKSLTDEQSLLTGVANGQKVSVRALAYIMAGHELHHLKIINERYL